MVGSPRPGPPGRARRAWPRKGLRPLDGNSIGTGLNAPDTGYYGTILETSGTSLLAVRLGAPQYSVTLDGSSWTPGVCPPYEIEFVALHPSNAYLLLVRDPSDGAHKIATLDANGANFRVLWDLATPASLPGPPASVNFHRIRYLGGRLYAVGQTDTAGLVEEIIDVL